MSKYVIRDENGVAIAMITDYQYKQILDEGDIEFGVITLKNAGKVNIVKIMSDCKLMVQGRDFKTTIFLWKDYYVYKV
jgi:hypothetical protein